MFSRNKTVGLIGRALALWALAGLFGISAKADTFGGFTYTTNSTSATITAYTGTGGDVVIPDVLGGKPVTQIQSKAFYYRSDLTSAVIPASVQTIGTFNFASCFGMTSINVDTNNPSFSSDGGVLFNKAKTILVQYPAGRSGTYTVPTGVTNLGYSAFFGCSITGVTLSVSVNGFGKYTFDTDNLITIAVDTNNPTYSSDGGVLFNKTKSTLIQYPTGRDGTYTVPAGVTSIGEFAFYECRKLTGVAIPLSTTRIEASAFGYCYGLLDIMISASVTNIGDDAFLNCLSLSSINVDANNPSYCSDNGVLLNKAKTILIQCPAGWIGSYEIPSSVTNIGDNSFFCCEKLTGVSIPLTATRIGSFAFGTCSKLTNITIPSSVTNIGTYAFRYSGLTRADIPLGVTNLAAGVFYGCRSLVSIVIPTNITRIESYAFQSCTNLVRADFLGNAPSLGSSVFSSCAAGFKAYYLAGKAGFTSPTWNGYPSAVLGGAAILPPGIPPGTEYEAWVLTNAPGWNAVNFTAVPAEDFEKAWLVNARPESNMQVKTNFRVEQFSVGTNQIYVTLGLGIQAQPKTGPVNGWLAVEGRNSMTDNWQVAAGQTADQNKLSFTNGHATVLFDKPASMRFFRPKLQKAVPNGGAILPLNQLN